MPSRFDTRPSAIPSVRHPDTTEVPPLTLRDLFAVGGPFHTAASLLVILVLAAIVVVIRAVIGGAS